MDPARMFKESLTSRPELENSQGQFQKSERATVRSASTPTPDIVGKISHVGNVPIATTHCSKQHK